MSRLFTVALRARSLVARVALTICAGAVLAAGAAGPASAATVLSTNGRVGGISLVDSSTNPGVTCKFFRPLFSLDQSLKLGSIILRGPTVGPIVNSAADGAIVPALVSVDFQVRQPLIVNGEPAGSRLVLSGVHQVLATSLAGVAVPDHTFDASKLPSGRYTAQVVVTHRSVDQSATFGSRTIRYDFYKRTFSEFLLGIGLHERVLSVGSSC
jgi:hypothetical protein